MATTVLTNIEIGDGHVYDVQVNDRGRIVATACRGLWPMSNVPVGGSWLDSELQIAAERRLDDEK